MARVKGAMMTRKRRNKILKLAKGYWGAKSKHYKMANEQVMKSLQYAYVGRRLKKRDFRQLWIARINAACKMNGMNYSTFMHGLKLANIEINRKMLAELAVNDKAAFTQLTELAKSKLQHLQMLELSGVSGSESEAQQRTWQDLLCGCLCSQLSAVSKFERWGTSVSCSH